jgi:hypothetical protein
MNGTEASLTARSGLVSGLYALAAAVLALALTGGVISLRLVQSQPPGSGLPPGTVGNIGKEMRTSFGSILVEQSNPVTGLGAKALAGMTHGIQNLVTPDKALQQITVAIANEEDSPLPYSPRQFSALLADGTRVPVLNSNVPAGTLRPHSAIELKLGFVVPRKGESVRVQFADKGGEPVTVKVGKVGVARAGASEHQH